MIAKSWLKIGRAWGADIKEIENYEEAFNDRSSLWVCHHRLETDKNLTSKQLKEMGMYSKVPPEQLIFLPNVIHSVAHILGRIPDKDIWSTLMSPPIACMCASKISMVVMLIESNYHVSRFSRKSSMQFWSEHGMDIMRPLWRYLDEKDLKTQERFMTETETL